MVGVRILHALAGPICRRHDLSGAHPLTGPTHLPRVHLSGIHLTRVHLPRVHLSWVLSWIHLSLIHLSRVHLPGISRIEGLPLRAALLRRVPIIAIHRTHA